jgi:hypothetical protein
MTSNEIKNDREGLEGTGNIQLWDGSKAHWKVKKPAMLRLMNLFLTHQNESCAQRLVQSGAPFIPERLYQLISNKPGTCAPIMSGC